MNVGLAHRRRSLAKKGVQLPGPEVFEGDVWYAATEVAHRLSVSRDTVVRWGQSGSVKAVRIGRSVRYLGADLNALMVPLGAVSGE